MSNPVPANATPIIRLFETPELARSIFTALAGGNPTRTTIDPQTGVVSREQVPLSTKQVGMELAAAVLSGAFNGLAERGPGAESRAAAVGFNTTFQQQQQAKAEQEKQAQADAESQSKAYARAASIAATNSQTALSTAEAEGRGADTLQKIAATNKWLIDGYEYNGNLVDRNVTQDDLLAGMQSGKYNSTAQLGPIDGIRLLGGGKVEATHAIITDPTAKVPLTQDAGTTMRRTTFRDSRRVSR